MGSETLLPCPFCGNAEPTVEKYNGQWWVRCRPCNYVSAPFNGRATVLAWWSRRTPPREAPSERRPRCTACHAQHGTEPCKPGCPCYDADVPDILAAPQQTTGEAPAQCMACSHGPERHTPECDCGCWGFFRAGARRCDNPRCEGSGCIALADRPTDTGSERPEKEREG